MANTENFGWSTPDNTGLVKDGAQDIRTLGSAIDNSMGELLGGDTGQVLAKSSDTDMDFVWTDAAGGDPATPRVAGVVLGSTNGSNTSLGDGALESVTTGFGNVALGILSLTQNTTGYANVSAGNNSLVANTVGTRNTAYGNASLGSNTTGEFNSAAGNSSLPSNTTGNNNTAFGSSSLTLNSTGSNNTALGREAGSNITTGSNNTVIGMTASASAATVSNEVTIGNSSVTRFRVPGVGLDTSGGTTGQALVKTGANTVGWASAGASPATPTTEGTVFGKTISTSTGTTSVGYDSLLSPTGSNNTAVGSNALRNTTTGENNTAIGWRALRANTTGSNNTAIGRMSINGQLNGDNNVAIGFETLSESTTGTINNTAVGTQAMRNGGGSYQTAIGNIALRSSTSSSERNTAVGYYALGDTTSGIKNVGVGFQAGYDITTGSNNIVIGDTARTTSPTVSNEVTIGDGSITRFRVPGVGLDTSGGTTGQVLAKTGSNTVGWVTPGGGGATLIETQTLSGSTRWNTFNSIPQTYESLRLIWISPGSTATDIDPFWFTNGNADAIYTSATTYSTGQGNPLSTYFYQNQNGAYFGNIPSASQMVSAKSMCIIDIPFYSLSTPTKTATTTSYYEGAGALVDEFWEVKTFIRDMGPITRLDIRDTSWNFQAGTMSLYGIN